MSIDTALRFTSKQIPSDPTMIKELQDRIEAELKDAGIVGQALFDIKLALHEALVNAIKHGNQYDRNKTVLFEYALDDQKFAALIKDQGEGFDPEDVPDPTAIENLERSSGRGLLMMRHYMTGIAYSEQGNTVAMLKIVSQAEQSADEVQQLLSMILQRVDDPHTVEA